MTPHSSWNQNPEHPDGFFTVPCHCSKCSKAITVQCDPCCHRETIGRLVQLVLCNDCANDMDEEHRRWVEWNKRKQQECKLKK